MKMKTDQRELDKIYKRRDRYEIPDWQRDEVWDDPRKQKLIDTILRGWKLPKFYFFKTDSSSYEVVDGQQRLSAIWEFLSGKLELSDETAEEFGGRTYAELPPDVSDRIDDFKIDFDEIEDADDDELAEFFQRLQSGLQLNSSEKLNAVPGKLKQFCRRMAEHKFFKETVRFNDKRYAHFDVAAKAAVIEVEGVKTGLRLDDVKAVFESQANFSDRSAVAKRLMLALDYLHAAFGGSSKVFRARSTTQSFITLVCSLIENDSLKGREKKFAAFAENFMTELTREVEKGHIATDFDYIMFQNSVNANVKSGALTRHQVLFRKLLQFDPELIENISPTAFKGADIKGQIAEVAARIGDTIERVNEVYAAKFGRDLFKATNRSLGGLNRISRASKDRAAFVSVVSDLYIVFWEGAGDRVDPRPSSFQDINALRTDMQHDVDHGGGYKKKKQRSSEAFARLGGAPTPSVASPEQIQLAQLNLLSAIERDIGALLLLHS